MKTKASWWRNAMDRPIIGMGRTLGELLSFCIILGFAVAAVVILGGCSVDTSRPEYKVRVFETQDQIDRKFELRMQSLRDRHRRRHHHRY